MKYILMSVILVMSTVSLANAVQGLEEKRNVAANSLIQVKKHAQKLENLLSVTGRDRADRTKRVVELERSVTALLQVELAEICLEETKEFAADYSVRGEKVLECQIKGIREKELKIRQAYNF